MKSLLLSLLWMTPALAVELSATKPQRGSIHRWITLPAGLAPWQEVELKARVDGYVKRVAVDKGDVVKAGDTLVEIEVPELEADLIRHRAEVAAAEIEVKRLHEARAKSPDLILPQQVDDAEARLAMAKAGLERADTLLAFAQIKAPFDGVITDRKADPGAFAGAGGGTLLRLTDSRTLRLQVPVIEVETGHLQIGQPVEAKIDALGGAVLKGVISRIAGALDPATRTMLVEADFKNEEGKLRPGMFATARLALERRDNVLLIPAAALVKEKVHSYVFKHEGGKAVRVQVRPGFNDGARVEVPDLAPDAVILLPGAAALADGQEVMVK